MKLTINAEISIEEIVNILKGGSSPSAKDEQSTEVAKPTKMVAAKKQRPWKAKPSKAPLPEGKKKGKGYAWTQNEDQWLIDRSRERKDRGWKLGPDFYDEYRKAWGVERSNQAIYLRLRKITAN